MGNKLHKKRQPKEQQTLRNSSFRNIQLPAEVTLGASNSWSGDEIQNEIEYHETASEIERERQDKVYEINEYLKLAHSYKQKNQIQNAIECYEKALENVTEEDKENETNAYLGLGHAYQEKNQIQMAIDTYEIALQIAREKEDKENETNAYFHLGML